MKHWILIIFVLAACVACGAQAVDEAPECFYHSRMTTDTGDFQQTVLLFEKYVTMLALESNENGTIQFPLVDDDSFLWGGPCENTGKWLKELSRDYVSHEISPQEYFDYYDKMWGNFLKDIP